MIGMIIRILKVSRGYQKRVAMAAVCSFLKAFISKAPIIAAYCLIAGFIGGTVTGRTCLAVGGALALGVLLQCLFQNLADRLQSAAGFEIFADLRKKLGAHLRKVPMGFFTEGNIGRISSVLSTDMLFIEENLMMVLADLMSYLFSAAIFVVFMFVFDWRLGVLSVLVTLVMYGIGESMKKQTLMHSDRRQQASQELTEAVLDFAEGIGVIKTYNLLGEKSRELTASFADNCEKSLRFEEDYAPWSRAVDLTYGVGSTAMLAASWMLYRDGAFGLAEFLGMLLFLFELFSPLKAFYSQVARLTVMNSCMDRIEAVFGEPELSDRGISVLELPARSGENRPAAPAARGAERSETAGSGAESELPEIEFRGVSFAYDEREILHDISFAVPRHTMTALVGASGSGKSTIANLLPRFWDVRSGAILIRGRDIREVTLASLMDNISMVFQGVYLFRDTVLNNIAMGRTDASREEVIDAARKARCFDFIEALPRGFDTVVGEGGASLSIGEQQRISIARCILKDAPIVILDEATASVDADNESHIQAAISELVKGKTLLVIAHRLHTIAGADQILVIDGGRIAERGTHAELWEKGGVYRNMVDKRAAMSGLQNR